MYLLEAIQLCCGGYTVMLRRLYSHVAEDMQVVLVAMPNGPISETA